MHRLHLNIHFLYPVYTKLSLTIKVNTNLHSFVGSIESRVRYVVLASLKAGPVVNINVDTCICGIHFSSINVHDIVNFFYSCLSLIQPMINYFKAKMWKLFVLTFFRDFSCLINQGYILCIYYSCSLFITKKVASLRRFTQLLMIFSLLYLFLIT